MQAFADASADSSAEGTLGAACCAGSCTNHLPLCSSKACSQLGTRTTSGRNSSCRAPFLQLADQLCVLQMTSFEQADRLNKAKIFCCRLVPAAR